MPRQRALAIAYVALGAVGVAAAVTVALNGSGNAVAGLVIALALAAQLSERLDGALSAEDRRVGLTPGALVRGAAMVLAGYVVLNGLLELADPTSAGHERSTGLADGALDTGLGVLAILLMLAGTRRLPGLRLRDGAPVTWVAVVVYCAALANQLKPAQAVATVTATASGSERAVDLITGSLPFLLVGVAAVGPWVRRSTVQALERLGAVPPRLAWVGLGIACGALLVPIGEHVLDLLDRLSPADCLAQQAQVEQGLAGTGRSWLEQVGVATAAGAGEETLFRGALQPRTGILLASVLWAAFHLQYTCHGFPGVTNLYILLLGLVFGVLRARFGLLAAIAAHTAYDAVILLGTGDAQIAWVAVAGSLGALALVTAGRRAPGARRLLV